MQRSKTENISVAVRVRPPNAAEADEPLLYDIDAAGQNLVQDGKVIGPFNRIHRPDENNRSVFEGSIRHLLFEVISGYNGKSNP